MNNGPTMGAHTCTFCNHYYNSSAKRPLVLPCSHCFCQDCLQQVEAAGDKLCPVCRKTWNNVKLSDLPFCYHLIPAEDCRTKVAKSKKKVFKGAAAEAHEEACSEHVDQNIFWCNSCSVPCCKQCWRQNHRKCEVILMEEKSFKDIHSTRLIALKNSQRTKFQLYHSNNKKYLEAVKTLQEKLRVVETNLSEYQSSLESWQSEVNKVVTIDLSRESNIQKISDNITVLEKLEAQLPQNPQSLLPPIADAYQNSGDDAEAFISCLRSIHDASVAPYNSAGPRTVAAPACTSLAEAAKLLKDGEVWSVADRPSAAAVRHLLCNTSIRPKGMEMIYTDIPEHTMTDIKGFVSANEQYEMNVKVEMDCFHHSEKPAEETKAATTAKLAVLLTPTGWGTLTQFWGHLNAAAVQNLPVTTKSVGLVLRDQEDMAAVNALCGAAFESKCQHKRGDRLRWKDWTDLNLAVTKTFRPEHWKLTWKWVLNEGGWKCMSDPLPTSLYALGVRLCLHLPQLLPGDRRWMGDLFREMGLTRKGSGDLVHMLLLPSARINPDPLLGVLRDSGQHWEVHLPTSLPQLVPRGEVTERYKEYGHSVIWDLE